MQDAESQEAGASTIHSAELLRAPGTASDFEKDLPVVTSLMVVVNLPVEDEYFTVADITLPGWIISEEIATDADG